LKEFGRIERTDFMLTWISEPAVRRTSQVMLNKGEMSHVLSDAIRIHRHPRIMDRTQESQSLRGKAGQFVKAMVVLSNTLDAGALVEQRRASGIGIPEEVLRHISPLGTRHLIFNVDYLWDKAGRKVSGSREKQAA
jgi:TnpA family transposase